MPGLVNDNSLREVGGGGGCVFIQISPWTEREKFVFQSCSPPFHSDLISNQTFKLPSGDWLARIYTVV